MAQDIVINWPKKTRAPTKLRLRRLLLDFFGDVAIHIYWKTDRFYVCLGKTSPCLGRLLKTEILREAYRAGFRDERWIEIWPDRRVLYVMTRRQDELTNCLAVGLAKVIAHCWGGLIETE